MILKAVQPVAGAFCITALSCAFVSALCPVDTVIVKGRADPVPSKATVRVQLFYAKGELGESAEATLEDTTFNIPIEFLTQSRRPVLNGNLFEKCKRKPKTVVISLIATDHNEEYDRVSLDFAKDFKMVDLSAYALRSEVVLNGLP
jgi:hypothetical protein